MLGMMISIAEPGIWGDEVLSERLNPTVLGDDLPQQGAWLRNKLTNKECTCRVCGSNGHWLPEGAVWVCEHDPIEGVPCRVLDSVRRATVYAYDPLTGEAGDFVEVE